MYKKLKDKGKKLEKPLRGAAHWNEMTNKLLKCLKNMRDRETKVIKTFS